MATIRRPLHSPKDHQRYDLQHDPDGTWSVVDIFTGWPVIVDEVIMTKMDAEDADEMVDLLNFKDKLDRERRARGAY